MSGNMTLSAEGLSHFISLSLSVSLSGRLAAYGCLLAAMSSCSHSVAATTTATKAEEEEEAATAAAAQDNNKSQKANLV